MTLTRYIIRRTRPNRFTPELDAKVIEYYSADDRLADYWVSDFEHADTFLEVEEATTTRDRFLEYSADYRNEGAALEIVAITISLGEVV